MTTRDIEAHLAEVYWASVPRELISNITDVVDGDGTAIIARSVDDWAIGCWPRARTLRRCAASCVSPKRPVTGGQFGGLKAEDAKRLIWSVKTPR